MQVREHFEAEDNEADAFSASLMTDTHCHLDLFNTDEVPSILSRAREAGVGQVISVAVNAESARRAVEYADKFVEVFATVGIHPHEASQADTGAVAGLESLSRSPKVVAVGETGLDYYRMRAPKAAQIEAFQRHIELAESLGLPLIIHCRDAYDDLIEILERTRPAEAVVHCFSGGLIEAVALLGLNCYISIAGTITFSNATRLQEVAVEVPMDRLLIETDAPYLAPQPHRGQRNEPSYLRFTAAKIAEIKGLVVEEVIKDTALNADKLFGLKSSRS